MGEGLQPETLTFLPFPQLLTDLLCISIIFCFYFGVAHPQFQFYFAYYLYAHYECILFLLFANMTQNQLLSLGS